VALSDSTNLPPTARHPRQALLQAAEWFRRRTLPSTDDAAAVAARLRGRQVSVVLPARNEESTIGDIVTTIRERLVDEVPLVHEIIVVDSRSTDATTIRAGSSGAIVHRVPRHGRDGGKGEALQAGLSRMTGDVGVFLDSDVRAFDPAFVVRLVDALTSDPSLVLVKAFYDRPSDQGGGGRVTELVARPLLRRLAPELSAVVQPLAGETAFVRGPMLRLPFVSGYGVEIGMLLQVLAAHGLDAIGQTDLGVREHSHQELAALARMAVQIESAFSLCRNGGGAGPRAAESTDVERPDDARVTFRRDSEGAMEMRRERVPTWLLPPLTED
jgi:glucosyl-3-phosphoglycerate synthase